MRNSSGVWLINYFNLGEVFSFLEDLISLDQDLGSYGSVDIYMCDLSTWPSSVIRASPFQPRSLFCQHSFAPVCAAELGFSWSFCMWLLFSPSLSPPFLSASVLVFDFWYEFYGHLAGALVGMRKPMALVLNKTQKLDVGTLVIEKVHLHLSVYLAFKVAVRH
jgi:hypothetical protein